MVSEARHVKHPLSPRLKDGLNAARACAATYVVLHHVALSFRHSHPLVGALFGFGQEAVIIFFLLSGFVIFANEQHRSEDWRGYCRRRFFRIYPPLLIAMGLSTLIFIDNGSFERSFRWSEFLGTLASVQDLTTTKPGVITAPYLNNAPLWSLSYEVAFYVMFPFVLRAWFRRPQLTNHLIGLASCICFVGYVLFPNHWALMVSYFLIWWVGAMCADAYFRGCRSVLAVIGPCAWLLLLCALSVAATLMIGFHSLGDFPFIHTRHFVFSALVVVSLFSPLGRILASLATLSPRAWAFLASISYGLYVFHYPLFNQWDRASTPAGAAAAVVILVVLSYLADDRLHRAITKRVGSKRPPAHVDSKLART